MDKTKPTREQNLVDWARPYLTDARKIERVIDPALDGQYSTRGALKAAAVAYQCLNQNPKSRPQMSAVIEALEPLLDLTDGTVTFVYNAEAAENGTEKVKENVECKGSRSHKEKGSHGQRHKVYRSRNIDDKLKELQCK